MTDTKRDLAEAMARNVKAVHVPIATRWQDRCEAYGCEGRAVERCGRRDARVCAACLDRDAGCKAIHRTLGGRVIYR